MPSKRPLGDEVAYDAHLSACRRLVAGSVFDRESQIALPGSMLDFQVPAPRGPLPMVLPAPSSSRVQERTEPVMGYVMRVSKIDLTWESLVDRRMVAAIRKWSAVILRAPGVFDLGRRCSTAAPFGEQLPSMLKHVFAGRSPGTLHNRAGPVLRYLAWCDSNETMPLPFSEEAVYVFCTYLESTCAPTFMKSLVTSISFCHHVLGAAGALDCLQSNRLLGVARLTYLRKRKKLQRPPFTVEMVIRLELFICDSANGATDRICAGFFVLLIFMRARYSDGQAMWSIHADPGALGGLSGYLEAEVSRTKVAFTTERKTMLLPMVAPRCGLSGRDWYAAWQEVRRDRQVPSGEGIPLLPSLASESGWTLVPPTAAVAGSWLRGLLVKVGYSQEVAKPYGTHSCKVTCLSYCAKFGIEPFHRRVLGYHSQPGEKVMHIYSRDTVSASVRELERVLEAVRGGSFSPDNTRSGYFTGPEGLHEEYDVEASGSEPSMDDEDNLADVVAAEEACEGLVEPWSEDGQVHDGDRLVRHKTSRMLHALADDSGTVLRCGRMCSNAYESLVDVPRFLFPTCKKCFKHA